MYELDLPYSLLLPEAMLLTIDLDFVVKNPYITIERHSLAAARSDAWWWRHNELIWRPRVHCTRCIKAHAVLYLSPVRWQLLSALINRLAHCVLTESPVASLWPSCDLSEPFQIETRKRSVSWERAGFSSFHRSPLQIGGNAFKSSFRREKPLASCCCVVAGISLSLSAAASIPGDTLSDRRQLSAPAGGAGGWWAVNNSPSARRHPPHRGVDRSVSTPHSPAFHRSSSQVARARRELGAFFGVSHGDDPLESEKWNQRRLRMIARKFGNVKSRKLQPREDDELDSVTTAGAPPVRRIFSRDLRQPSRYGDRAEKLHALSALKAGVQWKMATMAKRWVWWESLKVTWLMAWGWSWCDALEMSCMTV